MDRETLIEQAGEFRRKVIPDTFARSLDDGDMADFALSLFQWKRIEDGLPECSNPWPVEVFAVIKLTAENSNSHLFYESCKFYEGEWTNSGGKLFESDITRVIAWMPIPEHKEEEK